ncbi:MAG: DNA-directed RNA polymerase subunit beta, partial [Clostridia bacterium]|nr:DNA-directed RNA polymerase subunit beta [Clostridia bacterium]
MLHKVHNPAETAKEDRLSFAEIDAALEMPDLIEIQKSSYQKFIKEDLGPIVRDFSPIDDFSGSMSLEFLDCYLEEKSKYSIEECKDRDVTYAAPMRVRVRLTLKNDDGTVREILEQDVFMGDFPLMTPTGTFIINGAERVVASQLVRSPGSYFSDDKESGKFLFTATLIPNRGAWMEFEVDHAGVFSVKVDRSRKVSITALLRALGYGTDEQLIELLGESDVLAATIEHDHQNNINSEIDGLVEMYRRIRPGESAEERVMRERLTSSFFESRHYDLARVGRYKFNKKLALASRIENEIAAEDIVSPDGELLIKKGERITTEKAFEIQNAGVMTVHINITLKNESGEETTKTVRVMANGFIDPKSYLSFDPAEVGLKEYVYYDALMKILSECSTEEQIKARLIADKEDLSPEHLYMSDIVASINYMIALCEGHGKVDDIDHLGNRRVRCVGELLQNQLRVGLSRMERVIRERMTSQSPDSVSPATLINIRPVSAVIREFFGSSQLSQFMDQNNPLAELTHKRRLSALGPGGLNRDRPSFEVRDVHHSHYGRLCPIETPEGQNIGLIGSLATYARINEYGFMESPYRKVDKATGTVTKEVVYLAADDEDRYIIAQANEPVTPDGHFVNQTVSARNKDDFLRVDISQVDYIDVSPKQVVSVATAMIPFLENDDASRALMGANMQRQAVPLLRTEAPIVGTGIEYKAARDSGVSVLSKGPGVVKYVDADKIVVEHDDGETVTYELLKFRRSNQGTCLNQHPIVKKGQRVDYKTTLADGPSTADGELSLGRNITIAFMPWNGYNYEDAMLISERLARDDLFTTIHIEEYECEARDTKLGPEEITHDIPNVGEDMRRNLDEEGIIRIGAEVYPGDILVGKVTPKGETDVTAEERLLHAIFSNNAKEVRDTSLRVPHGAGGVVVAIRIFTRENKDELSPGVNKMVRVYLAQKRKVHAGDKMAGRHGNKGVISRVLPEEDMPFLPDGTPVQICLNPLGVPSRMNVGQVLEVHLGIAARKLGIKIATPVFDGAHEPDIEK